MSKDNELVAVVCNDQRYLSPASRAICHPTAVRANPRASTRRRRRNRMEVTNCDFQLFISAFGLSRRRSNSASRTMRRSTLPSHTDPIASVMPNALRPPACEPDNLSTLDLNFFAGVGQKLQNGHFMPRHSMAAFLRVSQVAQPSIP